MKEINKVLDAEENILWEGSPEFLPYLLSNGTPAFLIGLIWMGFLIPFLGVNFISFGTKGEGTGFLNNFLLVWNLILIPFVAIGMLLLLNPIYLWLVHKNLYYAITNKRVIIQKGLIGRDFEYIDFDQITNASVNVGYWDKVLGKNSGSIHVSSAGSFTYVSTGQQVTIPYSINNINNPYDVFKFFKKVSYDVKTDIQYPNKNRPSSNPGYKTDYDPNKK